MAGISKFGTLAALVVLVLASCATSRSVSRVSGDAQIDLSGRWNDTDSSLVAQSMIDDVIKRPWLSDFTGANNRKPIVIVGAIRNRSDEHIDAEVFINDIERELINSGKVSFVANDKDREAIRNERMNQQTEANPDTIKRLGQETGADFFMQGVITSTIDAVQGKRVVSYKVDLNLVNIETNETVWIGAKQIKKFIKQSSLSM